MFCYKCARKLELIKSQPWTSFYNCTPCDRGFQFNSLEPMGGGDSHFEMRELIQRLNPAIKSDPRGIKSTYRDYQSDFIGVTFEPKS